MTPVTVNRSDLSRMQCLMNQSMPFLAHQDSQSNTPCHYAAVLNLPGILRLLCEHGADCTLLSQGESLAALNIAAGNGYDEVGQFETWPLSRELDPCRCPLFMLKRSDDAAFCWFTLS